MDSPIQQRVPPVVINSACGLLCMGQFARYTAITDRLRGFHRERLVAKGTMTEEDAWAKWAEAKKKATTTQGSKVTI